MNTQKTGIVPALIQLLSLSGILFTALFLYALFTVHFRKAPSTLSHPHSLAVVPGAGITRYGQPSPALRTRLDKAVEFYQAGMIEKIFISGTQFEVISMLSYLEEQSIPDVVIIKDSAGDNTYQTVYNVRTYLSGTPSPYHTAFISQRYHLPRISLYAHRLGLASCSFIMTDYKTVNSESRRGYLMRETLAYVKAILLNH